MNSCISDAPRSVPERWALVEPWSPAASKTEGVANPKNGVSGKVSEDGDRETSEEQGMEASFAFMAASQSGLATTIARASRLM